MLATATKAVLAGDKPLIVITSDPSPTSSTDVLVPVGPLISQIPSPGDGFPSSTEAEHWRLRGCGIACVRMVLDAHQVGGDSYWSLITEGLDSRAYCDRGWIHQGLVDMAARRGVSGRAVREARLDEIDEDLQVGRLVIASVTACFRGGSPRPDGSGHYSPGGHLVLVTGVRQTPQGPLAYRVHHPSATPANNLSNHWIETEAMTASFSGNYLAFD